MKVGLYSPEKSDAEWKILGPGGGGAQYTPTVSPHDPETVLVACDMTGSYLTHDGGRLWKELNFKAWAGSFAFDPVNPGVIYAGATGLYRSEDNGDNWELLLPDPKLVTGETTTGDHADHSFMTSDNWPGGKIIGIAIDPTRPDRLLIGLNPGSSHAEGINEGKIQIYYSGNRGASWKNVFAVECGADYTGFVKIFFDPATPEENRNFYIITDKGIFRSDTSAFQDVRLTLPANSAGLLDASWSTDKQKNQTLFYIVATNTQNNYPFMSAAYRSDDLCGTWQRLESGLDADLQDGQARLFKRIAACVNDPGTVYLSCSEPTPDIPNKQCLAYEFGVFKSTDRGEDWKWALKIDDKNPENREIGWLEQDYATDWGGAPFNFGVSPGNPDICYVSDWGTSYRTIDGGKTWEQVYCDKLPDGSFTSRGLDVTNVYGIYFDPFNPRHLAISCTDIGLFQSFNGGAGWNHSMKGVPAELANTCYCVVFDTEVEGRAWSLWANCHDLPRPKMLRGGNFGKYKGAVCKTEDGMDSWVKTSEGMPENCVPTDIILDPKSPPGKRTLYAAGFGKGVFKSTDDGKTWALKNKGIGDSLNAWKLVQLPEGTIYLLVARGLKNGRETDGALYASTDGAESWTGIEMPDNANFPNCLCYDPNDLKRLYLACWPKTVNGTETGGGAYVSENGGKDWVNVFSASAHVYGIAADKRNPSTVFLTTFEGTVNRSDDGGRTWGRLGGYDFKWAKLSIPDPHHSGMIYITTFGSSVWYGPDCGTGRGPEKPYSVSAK